MTFIGFTVNLIIIIIIIFSTSVVTVIIIIIIIIVWGFVQFNIFQIRVQLGVNFMV